MGGGINVTQVPATVVVVTAVPDDGFVLDPGALVLEDTPDGTGLGVAPGAGLLLASGAAITPGAVTHVVTTVVTGAGFGVGLVLPIVAAVPPVESAGLANGAAELGGARLGLVIGDWLGLVGVVRLGGVMLL